MVDLPGATFVQRREVHHKFVRIHDRLPGATPDLCRTHTMCTLVQEGTVVHSDHVYQYRRCTSGSQGAPHLQRPRMAGSAHLVPEIV